MDSSNKKDFLFRFWSFLLLLWKNPTLTFKPFSSVPILKKQSKYYPQSQGLQSLLPSNDSKSLPPVNSNHIVHSHKIKLPLSSSSSTSSPSSISSSLSLPSPPSSSSSSFPSPSLPSSSFCKKHFLSSLPTSSSLMRQLPPLPSSSSCNSLIKAMDVASPYKSCAPYIEELLGTDSSVCMSSNEEVEMMWSEIAERKSQPSRKMLEERYMMAPKEYPPPLPSLAQNGKLASRVLTRYYENGRLIIEQQKLEHHHEYYETHRENGSRRLKIFASWCQDDDDDEMEENVSDQEMEALSEVEQNEEEEVLFEDDDSKLCPNYASAYEVGDSSKSIDRDCSLRSLAFLCPSHCHCHRSVCLD